MSTVTSAVTTCPELQGYLEENFVVCNDIAPDPITILPFLYSPENRTAMDFRVSPVPGKTRDLLVIYDQPIMDSEVTTISDCEGNCTATTKRGDLSKLYTIGCDGFMIEEIFDAADWRLSCSNNYDTIMRKILKMVAAMDNKNSKAVISDLGGLIGNYGEMVQGVTGDALIVKTYTNVSNEVLASTTLQKIQMAKTLTSYCAPAFIGGGQELVSYLQLMRAGCCSSSGLDLGAMLNQFGMAAAWDMHVEETYGKNISFMLQAGAIQLLTLNMNGGSEMDLEYINVGMGGGPDFYGIINSPWTGLPYDLTISVVCKKIHIILESRVQAVNMPIDMFPTGHYLEGVTFANIIQVVN